MARSPSRSADDDASRRSSRASRGTAVSARSTGRSVVVGVRAEDVYPASARPDLPTLDARVELVEALGSGVMAHFKSMRSRTARSGLQGAGAVPRTGAASGARRRSPTSSRTSLLGSTCGSPTRSPSRSIPARSTSSTRRRVRLSRRCLVLGVAAGLARCSRVSAAPSRTCAAQAPVRRRARGARAAADVPRAREPAHLLRDARPLRERRPRERPRRSERRALGRRATTRRTPAGTTAAT